MFRTPLFHHHGDDEMSKHWQKPPMQDEAKEEDGEKRGRTCTLARGAKISQEAHEVILIHIVSQVSDLFGKHITFQANPQSLRQHLTLRR